MKRSTWLTCNLSMAPELTASCRYRDADKKNYQLIEHLIRKGVRDCRQCWLCASDGMPLG